MECPTCKAPFQPGDKFCGNCGERLPDAAAAPAGGSVFGGAPVGEQRSRAPFAATGGGMGAPSAGASGGLAGMGSQTVPCPTCGAALIPGAPKCDVCGMEFIAAGVDPNAAVRSGGGGSPFGGPSSGAQQPAVSGSSPFSGPSSQSQGGSPFGQPSGGSPFGGSAGPSSAPPAPPREIASAAAVCPIHGEMDPTWSRCPQCLKEGREGRLITAGTGMPRPGTDPANRISPPAAESGLPMAQAPVGPPPAPHPKAPAPEFSPAEPPRVIAEQAPPIAPAGPPSGRIGGADRPQSSVGQTFVIRRRPRVLAYLIEKEGEQVGRVYQLEDDVTDIGRDPRNHVVVTDVMVSGFHARVERGPDGGFVVMDRGSSNGSRLNGEPLTSPRPLKENDEVGFGSTTLVLKVVT